MDEDDKTLAVIDKVISKIFYFNFLFAIIGVLITIPHLLITTRKAMRTSSTNSLIIGIALCDLTVASVIVTDRAYRSMVPPTPCINQYTYLHVLWDLTYRILRDTLTLTSYSLGLSLALIRLLVIKFSHQLGDKTEYITKTWTGYILVVLLGLLNAIPAFRCYRTVEIVNVGPWRPYGKCPGLPANYTEPEYDEQAGTEEERLESLASYGMTKGIMQLCISTIYPFLALILFFEIHRAAKRVKHLSVQKRSDRSRSSRMVMILTLSFVISSVPPGICYFFQTSVSLSSLGAMIVGYGTIFCLTLFTINASAHAIICLTMCSEYRKTMKKVFRMSESKTNLKLVTSRADMRTGTIFPSK